MLSQTRPIHSEISSIKVVEDLPKLMISLCTHLL